MSYVDHVIRNLLCLRNESRNGPNGGCNYTDCRNCASETLRDAIMLLLEGKEREKRICEDVCDYINAGCCTDTDADKKAVCHRIRQIFIKGR